jgi:hypothetical protein
MRFETEKEALLFMEYNADDILEETGKKPVRAYYCDVCMAWHLTSRDTFHTKSSYELLARRHSPNPAVASRELSAWREEVKRAEVLHARGSYKPAVGACVSVLCSVAKSTYSADTKKSFVASAAKVLENSLAMWLMQLRNKMANGQEDGAWHADVNTFHQHLQRLMKIADEQVLSVCQKFAEGIDAIRMAIKARKVQVKKQNQTAHSPSGIKQDIESGIRMSQRKLHEGDYLGSLQAISGAYQLLSCHGKEVVDEIKCDLHHQLCAVLLELAMAKLTRIDELIQEADYDLAHFKLCNLSDGLMSAFQDDQQDARLNLILSECHRLIHSRLAMVA